MPTDSSSLKKIKSPQIALTCPCTFASSFNNVITLANKTDQTSNHFINNHISKQIHERKASTRKQHLHKIDYKHNLTASGHYSKPIAKTHLHNRTRASTLKLQQVSDMNKVKAFNKQFTNLTYNTNKINRHIDQ